MINKQKVLMIEDDEVQISMYEGKFKLENFDFISTKNGKDGLKMAREEKPDIILLDLVMNGLSGKEVLKKLKENPKTKDIPVIVLTNLGSKETIREMEELGAIDFVIKSQLMPSGLVLKVKKVLEK